MNANEKVEVKRVSASHRKIYTEITINASPQHVWSVLTDFENYNWAHSFKGLTGDIQNGGQVKAHFQNPKNKKMSSFNHALSYQEGVEFGWSDKFSMGMKDNHVYRVEASAEGKSRFIQIDEVKGGLTWLMGGQIISFEKEHYPKFNRTLKQEVERRFPTT